MSTNRARTLSNIAVVIALGVVVFLLVRQYGERRDRQAGIAGGVLVMAPSYEERLDLALSKASRSTLGLEARQQLEKKASTVAIDRPDLVDGWPDGFQTTPLLSEPAQRALLFADDEQAAAQQLRQAGVDMVALHWRISPSIDRNRRVLSRLYHHDELSWFSLLRITDELLLYRVLEQPVTFPAPLAAVSIAALRAMLAGKTVTGIPAVKAREGSWEMMATIRGQGRELAYGLAHDKELEGVLSELADDLERGHRRYMEWWGFPPLTRHVDDLAIELHRVVEKAVVETREDSDLRALWELGIDGVIMRDYEDRKGASFPGAVSYTHAYRDVETFFTRAASFHHLRFKRPWRAPEVGLEMVRTVHFKEIPGKGIIQLYRGTPLVPMQGVTLESIRQGVLSAGEWYLTNLRPNGTVLYKFWPAENRESNEYNLVRHTLATWNLVQAWHLDPRPEFLAGARKALDFTLRWVVEDGDMAYITFNDNTKLGSVVVGLLGMIELAEVTGDHSHDALMRKFGEFVKFMQEPDGKFRGYHVSEDHPYFNEVNDIVPGEAALSLVYLSCYFDDPSYLEPLPAYWSYYQPWFRERVAKKREGAPWPAYTYSSDTRLELVQFGPWTVIAANAYHEATGDMQVARFGLEVARWMIETYEWTEDRAPYPDFVGGYYKLPNELPAMQAFCYGEGTAAAYELALRAAPEEAPFFEQATRETMRFALQMQFNEYNTYPFSRPWQVMGGIRYALNETKVRIDYVHHALSSMYIYLRAAGKDPNLPEGVRQRQEGAPPPDASTASAQPEEGETAQ